MIYGQDRAHLTWDDPFAEFREKNLSRRGGSRWRAGMKNRRNSVFDVLNVAAPCQWLSAEDAVFVALARCHGTPFEEKKKKKKKGKNGSFVSNLFFTSPSLLLFSSLPFVTTVWGLIWARRSCANEIISIAFQRQVLLYFFLLFSQSFLGGR